MNHFHGAAASRTQGTVENGMHGAMKHLTNMIVPVLEEPPAENKTPKSLLSILPTIQCHSALMDLARTDTGHEKQLKLSHCNKLMCKGDTKGASLCKNLSFQTEHEIRVKTVQPAQACTAVRDTPAITA